MSRLVVAALILALLIAALVAFLLLQPRPVAPFGDPLEDRDGKPMKWSTAVVFFTPSTCSQIPRVVVDLDKTEPNQNEQVLWILDSDDPEAWYEIHAKSNETLKDVWDYNQPDGKERFKVPPGFRAVASGKSKLKLPKDTFKIWTYAIVGKDHGQDFTCDPEVCLRNGNPRCSSN